MAQMSYHRFQAELHVAAKKPNMVISQEVLLSVINRETRVDGWH